MRLSKCWFCSITIYPGRGMTFIRNDSTEFRFCGSKCHKNFKLKRNPRKVKWTKASRRLRKKELKDDPLARFAVRRSAPAKYEPAVVGRAVAAIDKVEKLRGKKGERAFLERTRAGRLQEKRRRLRFIKENLDLVAAPQVLKGAQSSEERAARAVEFLRRRRRERILTAVGERKHKRLVLKSIIDHLRKTRENLTLKEILDSISVLGAKVAYEGNPEVEEYETLLLKHSNVSMLEDSKRFYYTPNIKGVKSKNDILKYLKRHPAGVLQSDFYDCFFGVVKEMKRKSEIVAFPTSNLKKYVLFAKPEFTSSEETANCDLKDIWKSVDLPKEDLKSNKVFMRKVLEKNGHKIFSRAVRKRSSKVIEKKKGGSKRRWNRVNLTNKHLKDKFEIYKNIAKQ